MICMQVINFGRKDGTEFVVRALPIGGYATWINLDMCFEAHGAKQNAVRGKARSSLKCRKLSKSSQHVCKMFYTRVSIYLAKERTSGF